MNFWEDRGPDKIIMAGYLPGQIAEGTRDGVYGPVTDVLVAHDVKSVVDAGGGLALLGQYMRDHGYEPRYTVVDINPHAVNWCTENGWNAEVGDVAELPFRKNQVGAVTLLAVLEHLPSFEPGLRDAFRVARSVVVVVFWKNLPGDEEITRYFEQGFYENTYKHDDIIAVAHDCGWALEDKQILQGREVQEAMYVFVPDRG